MFRGQFVHSIDAKGRISLPSRLRDQVKDSGEMRLVVTPSPFDPCLHVYPLAAWEAFEERMAELPSMDPHIVRFRRLYVSAATECELDKANRILVPALLREKAELGKEALWAGVGRFIELWSKPRFDEIMQITPDEQEVFRQAVLEQVRI
jgi:MraZ protein